MNVDIKEYKPSAHLSPYIELYWSGNFNFNSDEILTQRVIPYGYIELIIHLNESHCELLQGSDYSPSPAYTLIGLFTKPYNVQFRANVKVFGIRFKPEGIYHTFGLPASAIDHNFIDIEGVAGNLFKEFCLKLHESESIFQMISITENYLLKKIHDKRVDLYYLETAAEFIRKSNGRISVDELAGKVFISTRQLEREFKKKLGLSPKSYIRISRLNDVNRKIQNGERIDLTELSFSAGYADQAHFIRDFKQFTGESPKVFLSKKDQFIVNPNTADFI